MINWIVISMPLVAFWFAGVSSIPQRIIITNQKPFTCPKCMAFWLASGYQIYLGFSLEGLVISVLSSYASHLIETYYLNNGIPYNK